MEQENHGVIVEVKDTDYIAGFGSPIPYEKRVEKGWNDYLSKKEPQYVKFETFSCVSFSANHAVDTTMNFLIQSGYVSKEALHYFETEGYMDDGKFNTSDRFTAIMSGTTQKGNSLQNVLDSMDDVGLLPEKDLPMGGKNWKEYMGFPITQEMKDKAKKILEFIKIQYEWVFVLHDGANIPVTLATHLKHAPIQLCIPICDSYRRHDDPITTCALETPQHAVLCYDVDDYVKILDQYDPYTKNLSKDYPILYGMKIVVTSQKLPDPLDSIPGDTIDDTKRKNIIFRFIYKLFTGKEYRKVA